MRYANVNASFTGRYKIISIIKLLFSNHSHSVRFINIITLNYQCSSRFIYRIDQIKVSIALFVYDLNDNVYVTKLMR